MVGVGHPLAGKRGELQGERQLVPAGRRRRGGCERSARGGPGLSRSGRRRCRAPVPRWVSARTGRTSRREILIEPPLVTSYRHVHVPVGNQSGSAAGRAPLVRAGSWGLRTGPEAAVWLPPEKYRSSQTALPR